MSQVCLSQVNKNIKQIFDIQTTSFSFNQKHRLSTVIFMSIAMCYLPLFEVVKRTTGCYYTQKCLLRRIKVKEKKRLLVHIEDSPVPIRYVCQYSLLFLLPGAKDDSQN